VVALQLLCKQLAIDVKDLVPGKLLHGRRKPVLIGNPDFNTTATGLRSGDGSNVPGIIMSEVRAPSVPCRWLVLVATPACHLGALCDFSFAAACNRLFCRLKCRRWTPCWCLAWAAWCL
jgi:hypothetical protein